jgi:hypothetical protein
MIAVQLRLAGVDVRAEIAGPCDPAHVTARFGGFFVKDIDDSSAWTVRVAVEPGRWEVPAGHGVFPGAGVTRQGDAVVYTRQTDVTVLDPVARTLTVRARPSPRGIGPVEDPTPLDTPLRLLMAWALPRLGGVLVHACGWAECEPALPAGAVLFAAVSGGGKTTTARKLPHAGVLSDDQVALTRGPDGWVAHALPFVGEYRMATRSRSAPLRRVVLLAKGDTFRDEPVALARALGALARCGVYFTPGDAGAASVLDALVDVARSVGVARWTLALETPVLPRVREILQVGVP